MSITAIGKLVLASLLVLVVLVGCTKTGSKATDPSVAPSSGSSAAPSAAGELPRVELNWYLMSYKQMEDTALVEEAMNNILLKKINATIKINVIPFANYVEKMNVKIAAGDPFDIMLVNGATYPTLAAKGALVDLTNLIPKYAPDVQKVITPSLFNATKIAGKIYAVPNLQGLSMPTELAVRKDLFDKYHIPSSIKSFDELDGAFDKILNEDKVTPLHVYYSGGGNTVYTYVMSAANFFRIGSPVIPGVYTPDMKVINQYESDNFKNWVAWARKAYQKGWIEKNAATATEDFKSGKYASQFNAGGPQGREGQITAYGPSEFIDFGVKSTLTTAQIQATMNAVSSTSKNPERAMMLLNLINTDKELYNLMSFGIEGKHYVLKDGFRELPPGVTDDTNRYNMAVYFFIGNTYNRIPAKGENPNTSEAQRQFDAKAAEEPAMGLNYDATAMKTEIAQVTSVIEEYLPALATGSVDPDKYLPLMLDKLKTAGVDKIIADKQKQLDAFLASRK
ncbi:MAG: ABC transporter substrate-binding protein [Paenibacillaceae bacterium]|nr:ABC transporter substrate-binding protein [Paenibacillaceae bacterium]